MSSTSWPLWEVFIRSKLSHIHVGSLHATDSKMALENARDVYTRRMEGISIWVIPSDQIFAYNMTAMKEPLLPEPIHKHPTFEENISNNSDEKNWPQWEVFFRTKKGLSHKHLGSIQAKDAKATLSKALRIYQDTLEVTNIWVIPSNMVEASKPADSEAFYQPAKSKPFRHATYYKLPDAVKHM